MGYCHVLLTRFNLKIAYGSRDVNDADWLRARFKLFERFCLPSVMRQTEKCFSWLVFFDTAIPSEFRARITDLQINGYLVPVYLDEYCLDSVCAAVRRQVPESCQFVITTRVDNDDVLSRDFVERIQADFADGEMERWRALFPELPAGFSVCRRKNICLRAHEQPVCKPCGTNRRTGDGLGLSASGNSKESMSETTRCPAGMGAGCSWRKCFKHDHMSRWPIPARARTWSFSAHLRSHQRKGRQRYSGGISLHSGLGTPPLRFTDSVRPRK